MKKLLRRRDTAIVRRIDNEVDFQEGVIRVRAEQLGRSSWPVRLGAGTTAGDLVARWVFRCLPSRKRIFIVPTFLGFCF